MQQQGIIVCPLSFLIYINDLCKSANKFDVYKYIDDITLLTRDLNDIPMKKHSTVLKFKIKKVKI